MKNKLTITVAGQAMTGKSRVTFLLKQFLRERGFSVDQEYNIDHPTESIFDRVMSKDIDNVVDKLKKNTTIILKEKQKRYGKINRKANN